MVDVDVDGSSHFRQTHSPQVNWLGLRIGRHPVLSLHSSNELTMSVSWSIFSFFNLCY